MKILKLYYKRIEQEEHLNILNSFFVENNINKAKIIYMNKIYQLTDELKISDNSSEKIKIYLLILNDIIDGNNMFSECRQLLEIKEVSKNKISYESNNILLYNKNNIINANNSFCSNEEDSLSKQKQIFEEKYKTYS